MNTYRIYIPVLLIGLACLVPGVTHAATLVTQGAMEQITVWEPSGSPYIIDSPIVVHPTTSLYVTPGTVVIFGPQGSLLIKGELKGEGELENKIVFTDTTDEQFPVEISVNSPPPTSLMANHITVDHQGRLDLAHALLRYNSFALPAIGGGDVIAFPPMLRNNGGVVKMREVELTGGLADAFVQQSGTFNLEQVRILEMPGTGTAIHGGTGVMHGGEIAQVRRGVRVTNGTFAGTGLLIRDVSGIAMDVRDGGGTLASSTLRDVEDAGIVYESGRPALFSDLSIHAIGSSGLVVNAGDVVITGSSITAVGGDGVENNAEQPVTATGNWWGDAQGPDLGSLHGHRSSVSANVIYAPWLNHDPFGTVPPVGTTTATSTATTTLPVPPVATSTSPVATTSAGVSSVLFLPGLEGSRLYQKVLGIENKRWELSTGMSQVDAKALYLDAAGNSINPIYAKEGQAWLALIFLSEDSMCTGPSSINCRG